MRQPQRSPAALRPSSEVTLRAPSRTPRQRAPRRPFDVLTWALLYTALVGLTGIVARAGCVATAHAQAPETTLLRAVVAEATWLERDHRAILHVLARRADRAGITVDEMARRYVSALKRPIARTWVLELEPHCEQPLSWPAHLDWEAHRIQCELTVERVRAFLAGDSIDPCRGRATQWGAPNLASDLERAARAPWRRVDCGKTANIFYARRADVLTAKEASGQ